MDPSLLIAFEMLKTNRRNGLDLDFAVWEMPKMRPGSGPIAAAVAVLGVVLIVAHVT